MTKVSVSKWKRLLLSIKQLLTNSTPVNSDLNSTTTPLASGATFTGVGELNNLPDVKVTVSTDQDCTLYLEFSPDGTNWDSSIPIEFLNSDVKPPQVFTKGNRYFRVRLENTSASAQTYLRLHTYYGDFKKLTSSIDSVIPQTFGATVTRPIDFNLMVVKDLYQGHQLTLKDGINPDIDTGSTPEDIWGGGGTYTGFPTTAAAGEMVVSGADTGTVFYSYMETATDESYSFGSVAISGAGTYSLGHNIWRSNYMLFVGSGTSFNAGNITLRHTATPANIFNVIKTGQGQTFNAAYTVPTGHEAFIEQFQGSIRGGNTGAYADMFFYYRESGKTPLLRLPFTLNFGSSYTDSSKFLIRIPEKTDIIPRATQVGNNNTQIHISFRVLKVKI